MVIVELAFDDNPARLELRPKHREKLARLHAAGEVLVGGPFDDGTGSLIVLDTTRQRADEIVASDPYCHAEGVTVVTIREMTPVVGPG